MILGERVELPLGESWDEVWFGGKLWVMVFESMDRVEYSVVRNRVSTFTHLVMHWVLSGINDGVRDVVG